MRTILSLAAVLLAGAAVGGPGIAEDPPLLLGPICHAEPPPAIAGPHRLVMLQGMGDDHMADTRSPEAQRWFDYGLTLGDPPVWAWPVRRALAAARLARGDAAGAVRETSAALAAWKLDPLSLAVRAAAERALGEADAAAKDEGAARQGWHGPPAELSVAFAA